MKNIKIAILKNEDPYDHLGWVEACERLEINAQFQVIDITSISWMINIIEYRPTFCVLKPSGKTDRYRLLYQERVEIICKDLGIRVFPSYQEVRLYENKRYFSYWLEAHSVPHPTTWVFYHKKEAKEHSKLLELPIVGKINIGASGNGVTILRDKKKLKSYIEMAFTKGLVSRTGPKIGKGDLLNRLYQKLKNPKELINRLNTYKAIHGDRQIGFVLFQKYVEHNFEWRVVRIGDSFFAHKKLKVGDKASGTLLKSYENPPLQLLDFVRDLTDEHQFRSVAVDVFENPDRCYLVNEIQCIFGQSDAYQMKVDGIIGRYIYSNDRWVFEQGDFARNACYDLRLDYVIKTHNWARHSK